MTSTAGLKEALRAAQEARIHALAGTLKNLEPVPDARDLQDAVLGEMKAWMKLALHYEAELEARNAQEPEYEWGIMQPARPGIHRWAMTEGEAREWIAPYKDIPGVFTLVRRTVGEWEEVDD